MSIFASPFSQKTLIIFGQVINAGISCELLGIRWKAPIVEEARGRLSRWQLFLVHHHVIDANRT
jgi:hypothetical protein